MKLLAVFGLALAVVAVDKAASGDQDLPMNRSQVFLKLFKLDPNNPIYRSEILSKDPGCKISAAVKSEGVFFLIRDCLETGRSSLPKNFLEMDMVHVAALIFMFRVQGNEKAAEDLYNAVMEKHFPVQFEAKHHEESYPRNPLVNFKRLETPNPLEKPNHKMRLVSNLETARNIVHEKQLLSSLEAACKIVHQTQLLSGLEPGHKAQFLNSLEAAHKLVYETQSSLKAVHMLAQKMQLIGSPEADRERQFFMLWTVRMYGKGLEGQDAYQRVLVDADQVVLILVNMGFSLEVLAAGLTVLEKELPVGTTPSSLPTLLLMFFSLNRGWYLGLGELEKAQLRAFLERYLIAKLQGLGLQAETLSAEGLEKLKEAFESENEFRYKYLDSCTITKFAEYFCNATQAGCPAFLLKRMLDFYLEQLPSVKEKLPSAKEEVLGKRRCFLVALNKALKMVKDGKYFELVIEENCLGRMFFCSQIERTIAECGSEIRSLSEESSEKNSEAKEKAKEELGEASSARRCWTASKGGPKEVYSD